jgi:hypothetical protein
VSPGSFKAHIQIMFDPRYLRFPFHQPDHQLNVMDTGGRGQPKPIFCLRNTHVSKLVFETKRLHFTGTD